MTWGFFSESPPPSFLLLSATGGKKKERDDELIAELRQYLTHYTLSTEKEKRLSNSENDPHTFTFIDGSVTNFMQIQFPSRRVHPSSLSLSCHTGRVGREMNANSGQIGSPTELPLL